MNNTDPTLVLAGVFFFAAFALGTFIIVRCEAYRRRIERDGYNQAYEWATKQLTEGKISVALLDARVQKRLRSNPTTAFDRGVLDALRDFSRNKRESINKQIAGVR